MHNNRRRSPELDINRIALDVAVAAVDVLVHAVLLAAVSVGARGMRKGGGFTPLPRQRVLMMSSLGQAKWSASRPWSQAWARVAVRRRVVVWRREGILGSLEVLVSIEARYYYGLSLFSVERED